MANIEKVSQTNLVESIEQVRHKVKVLLKDMKEDPSLFEEALRAIRQGTGMAVKPKDAADMYRKSFAMERSKVEGNSHLISANVRVKIADEEEDDADSEQDQLAEQKHNDEMRRTRQRFM